MFHDLQMALQMMTAILLLAILAGPGVLDDGEDRDGDDRDWPHPW
jgi:hypothetical protein